jgi:class 3 adenylate cyclase
MFTDIVGYSVMASKNQDHALKLLSTHDTIIEPIIAQNGGSVIKKIGDSIFAEFPNSKVSVHAAQEIQTKLKKRNSICNINDKIEIRIGLHTGEVIRKDDDLFGHDVNLCSRIESISPRGGIAASTDLVSSIDNEFLYREMGYIKLKNIIPPKYTKFIWIRMNTLQNLINNCKNTSLITELKFWIWPLIRQRKHFLQRYYM